MLAEEIIDLIINNPTEYHSEEGLRNLLQQVSLAPADGKPAGAVTILYGSPLGSDSSGLGVGAGDIISKLSESNANVRIIDNTEAAKLLTNQSFQEFVVSVFGGESLDDLRRNREHPANIFMFDAKDGAWGVISERFVKATTGDIITLTPTAAFGRTFALVEVPTALSAESMVKSINGRPLEFWQELARQVGGLDGSALNEVVGALTSSSDELISHSDMKVAMLPHNNRSRLLELDTGRWLSDFGVRVEPELIVPMENLSHIIFQSAEVDRLSIWEKGIDLINDVANSPAGKTIGKAGGRALIVLPLIIAASQANAALEEGDTEKAYRIMGKAISEEVGALGGEILGAMAVTAIIGVIGVTSTPIIITAGITGAVIASYSGGEAAGKVFDTVLDWLKENSDELGIDKTDEEIEAEFSQIFSDAYNKLPKEPNPQNTLISIELDGTEVVDTIENIANDFPLLDISSHYTTDEAGNVDIDLEIRSLDGEILPSKVLNYNPSDSTHFTHDGTLELNPILPEESQIDSSSETSIPDINALPNLEQLQGITSIDDWPFGAALPRDIDPESGVDIQEGDTVTSEVINNSTGETMYSVSSYLGGGRFSVEQEIRNENGQLISKESLVVKLHDVSERLSAIGVTANVTVESSTVSNYRNDQLESETVENRLSLADGRTLVSRSTEYKNGLQINEQMEYSVNAEQVLDAKYWKIENQDDQLSTVEYVRYKHDAEGNIVPGSTEARSSRITENGLATNVSFVDDGNGNLVVAGDLSDTSATPLGIAIGDDIQFLDGYTPDVLSVGNGYESGYRYIDYFDNGLWMVDVSARYFPSSDPNITSETLVTLERTLIDGSLRRPGSEFSENDSASLEVGTQYRQELSISEEGIEIQSATINNEAISDTVIDSVNENYAKRSHTNAFDSVPGTLPNETFNNLVSYLNANPSAVPGEMRMLFFGQRDSEDEAALRRQLSISADGRPLFSVVTNEGEFVKEIAANNDGSMEHRYYPRQDDRSYVLSVTYDQDGKRLEDSYSMTFDGITFNAGEIGSTFGSIIAQLSGGNQLKQQVKGVLFSAIGENLAELAVEQISRKAADEIVDNAFSDFAIDLKEGFVGLGSSLLVSDIMNAVGIESNTGDRLNDLGSSYVHTVGSAYVVEGYYYLEDLARGGETAANAEFDVKLGEVTANFINLYVGKEIGRNIYTVESKEGAIGASIGATAGLKLGTKIGGTAAGPLGAIIGAAIGYVVGGFIGDIFGGTPRSGADLNYMPRQEAFAVSNTWSKDNGSANAAGGIANAVGEALNNILSLVGGNVVNRLGIFAGSYGLRKRTHHFVNANGDKKYFSNASDLIAYGVLHTINQLEIGGGNIFVKRALYSVADSLFSQIDDGEERSYVARGIESVDMEDELKEFLAEADVATDVIEQIDFDAYREKALAYFELPEESTATEEENTTPPTSGRHFGILDKVSVPEGAIETLVGSLTIALEYQRYIDNQDTIHAIMAIDPNSLFTAGWIATLERAKEQGLIRRTINDNFGGWQEVLSELNRDQEAFISGQAPKARYIDLTARHQDNERRITLGGADGEQYVVRDSIAAKDKDSIAFTNQDELDQALENDVDIAAVISGSDDGDVILGGHAGNDLLGHGGKDVLIGGINADWIEGGDGDDFLHAFAGNNNMLIGGEGEDYLQGGAGSDWLRGGDHDDRLFGGLGNDVLDGGKGQDTVYDIGGDDTYIFRKDDGQLRITDLGEQPEEYDNARQGYWLFRVNPETGHAFNKYVSQDTIEFGDGISLANLVIRKIDNDSNLQLVVLDSEGRETADNIIIENWENSFNRIEYLSFADGERVRIGTFSSFIIGTNQDDILDGTDGADFIHGLEGADNIKARMGADVAIGGLDDDLVSGDGGNDIVVGGQGSDSLYGGDGDDIVAGDEGNDTVRGGRGNDVLSGGVGNDNIFTGSGDDLIIYQRGDGHDTVVDAEGIETRLVFAEDQYYNGYTWGSVYQEVKLDGLPGDSDKAPSFELKKDFYHDRNYGGFDGGAIITHVETEGGGEVNNAGNDTLEFQGGIGINDIRVSSVGADLVLYFDNAQTTYVRNEDLSDSITIKNWFSSAEHAIENFRFYGIDDIDTTTFDRWVGGDITDDTLTGADQRDWITGAAGQDHIQAGAGDDIIVAGADNDLIDGGLGADVIYGGAGEDTVDYSNSQEGVQINLGAGTAINGDAEGDILIDVEHFIGSHAGDTFIGDSRDNEIHANGSSADSDNQGDYIVGGLGDDTYVFHQGDGSLTISEEGFEQTAGGDDTLSFGEGIFAANLNFAAVGNNLEITFDNSPEDKIVIEGWYSKEEGRIESFLFHDGTLIDVALQGFERSHISADNWLVSDGSAPVDGKQGNDILIGRENDDHLIGDSGDDIFFASLGRDQIDGGSGSDTISYESLGKRVAVYLDGSRKSGIHDGGYFKAETDLASHATGLKLERFAYAWGLNAELAKDANMLEEILGGSSVSSRETIMLDDERIALNEGEAHRVKGVIFLEAGKRYAFSGFRDDSLHIELGGEIVYSQGYSSQYSPAATFNADSDLHSPAIAETFTASESGYYELEIYAYNAVGDGGYSIKLSTDGATPQSLSNYSIHESLSRLREVGGVVGDHIRSARSIDADTLTDVENIIATAASDYLVGDDENNTIVGKGGNDRIYGHGGHDHLDGGRGYDIILGGEGDDVVSGGHETDLLYGGRGQDQLYGGEGGDTLIGESGADQLYGDTGNDSLFGGDDADDLFGGEGDDQLEGGNHIDGLYGGQGDDTLDGGAGDDIVEGGEGHDTLKGGEGVDLLLGGSGNDALNGGEGDDTLQGGEGNDVLRGDAGGDVIRGGSGTDSLEGGADDDYLNGESGDDTLNGGENNDVLVGGEGNDRLDGGAHQDLYIFRRQFGQDTVSDSGVGLFEGSQIGVDNLFYFADVDKEDLWFESRNGNVVISVIGTENQVTFHGGVSGNIHTDNAVLTRESIARVLELSETSSSEGWRGEQLRDYRALWQNQSFALPTDFAYAPRIYHTDISLEEDSSYSGVIEVEDLNVLDTHTFEILSQPEDGVFTLNSQTGEYSYTPAENAYWVKEVFVRVTDSEGLSSVARIRFIIESVNDAPEALRELELNILEGESVDGDIQLFDVDEHDSHTFSAEPQHGQIHFLHDGRFTYTPFPNREGVDRFDIVVRDREGAEIRTTVTINIEGVNTPPYTLPEQHYDTHYDLVVNGEIAVFDADMIDSHRYDIISAHEGELTIDHEGNFSYTPKHRFVGEDRITVRVTDQEGEEATTVLIFNVVSGNEKPEALESLLLETQEETAVSGDIQASDSDSGDSLSYSASPELGYIIFNADGSFVYTPHQNAEGSETFVIVTTDTEGATAQTEVTVNIEGRNDKPVTSETLNLDVNEDMKVQGAILVEDVDAIDSHSYTVTSAGQGRVEWVENGVFDYIPPQDFVGEDRFTVTVTDSGGLTSLTDVIVNVRPQNDAPTTLANLTLETREEESVIGNLQLSDPDIGDSHRFTLDSDPAFGQVAFNTDGSFNYLPNVNAVGQDSFVIRTEDAAGEASLTHVTVNISNVNDAPQTQPEIVFETDEDVGFQNQIAVFDPDAADSHSFAVTTGGRGHVHWSENGVFDYTPPTGFSGQDSFTVTIRDAQGLETSTRVVVNIAPLNDRPEVRETLVLEVQEDLADGVTGDLQLTDQDAGDQHRFEASPNLGEITFNADGTFRYEPHLNATGTDSFNVTVRDQAGAEAITAVTITITPENDAPVLPAELRLSTAEETQIRSSLHVSDPDSGDSHAFRVSRTAEHGVVTLLDNGTFDYTPNEDFNGQDRFTITVSDSAGAEDTTEVFVDVTPVNDLPSITDIYTALDEDSHIQIALPENDSEGDALTYQLNTDAGHGQVELGAYGSFRYTPDENYFGSDRVVIDVDDGHGDTVPLTINIYVRPVNDDPNAYDMLIEGEEGQTITGVLWATDVDPFDELIYLQSDDPDHGGLVLNGSSGHFSYTPESGFSGNDAFEVTVSDQVGGSDSLRVGLVVTPAPVVEPVNTAPTFADVWAVSATNEDESVDLDLRATDIDGDTLVYRVDPELVVQNGRLEALAEAGRYRYTPDANFSGTDAFRLLVDDGQGGSDSLHVQINIAAVNDAPEVQGDTTEAGPEDAWIAISIENVTDIEGDTLRFSVASDPANGTVEVVDENLGTFRYRADNNWYGTDSFAVHIDDGQGGITPTSVRVTVNPVNDRPVLAATQLIHVDEDASVSGQISASDIDNDSLHYRVIDAPDHGELSFTSDGRYTYTPHRNYNGSDSFRVEVDDGQGADNSTSSSTITLDVRPQNDRPSDIHWTGAFAIPEDASAGTRVGRAYAVDVDDSDSHSYRLTSNPDNLFTIDTDSGEIRVAQGARFDREDATGRRGPTISIEVEIVDSDGLSYREVRTIEIENVNESPVPEWQGDFSVMENLEAPVEVARVMANDPEQSGSELSYELVNDAGGRFLIDDNGVVYTTQRFDHEHIDNYTIQARVSDGEFAVLLDPTTVHIGDAHEAPTALYWNGALAIEENRNAGVSVATVNVTDEDEGDVVTLSLLEDAGGRFELDGNRIRSTRTFDFENGDGGSHRLRIRATDQTGLTIESTRWVDITNDDEAPMPSWTGALAVDENANAGTVVAKIEANDIDTALDDLSFELTNDAGKRFGIDDSGNIYTLKPLNHEDVEGHSHYVEVRVSDGESEILTANSINVNPINERPTEITWTNNFRFYENARAGTVVGRVGAVDEDNLDEDYNEAHYYTLTDSADGRFRINGNAIETTRLIDFDTEGETFNIAVSVRDAGGLSIETPRWRSITLLDIDEAPDDIILLDDSDPNNEREITQATVRENASVQKLAALNWSDPENDAVRFTVHDSESAARSGINSGRFEIRNGTDLYSRDSFNHEAPNSGFVIKATQSDNASLYRLERFGLNVTNQYEHPKISLTAPARITEHSPTGTTVSTISVSDDDAGESVSYRLVDSSNGRFRLSGNRVVLNRQIDADRESEGPFTFTVMARDSRGLETPASRNVSVELVNEAPTRIDTGRLEIFENTNPSVHNNVGSITAIDDDVRVGAGTPRLSFVNSSGRLVSRLSGFEIKNGQIVATQAFNHEDTPQFTLRVRARDATRDDLFIDRNVTITIENREERPYAIDFNRPRKDENDDLNTLEIQEGTRRGSLIGLTVKDLDGKAPAGGYRYRLSSITNNASKYFAIDESSGIVSAKVALTDDEEHVGTHRFRITVSEAGGSHYEDFTVNVINQNEAPVVIEGGNQPFEINEYSYYNGRAGAVDRQVITRVDRLDLFKEPDKDQTDESISYEAAGGRTDLFSIDSDTGLVRIRSGQAHKLNWENANMRNLSLQVRAVDSKDSSLKSGIVTLSIALRPVDEVEVVSTRPYTSVGANHFTRSQRFGSGHSAYDIVRLYNRLQPNTEIVRWQSYSYNPSGANLISALKPNLGYSLGPSSAIHLDWDKYPYRSPIALDLQGDGFDWLENVAFNMDSDEALEETAWLGGSDALLALDRNQDGLINDIQEISFADDLSGALTDMEGLVAFDSNSDGVFNAEDERYGEFLLWQDSNENGVSEDGELRSLSQAGIAGINLSLTPATEADAADAEGVSVLNTASFVFADGRVGQVADISFRFNERVSEEISDEDDEEDNAESNIAQVANEDLGLAQLLQAMNSFDTDGSGGDLRLSSIEDLTAHGIMGVDIV